MTSITDQKAELKHNIVASVLDNYRNSDTSTKQYIVALLIQRLAKTMTLSELQSWRNQLEKELER